MVHLLIESLVGVANRRAWPAVPKALEAQPSAEQRRRIEALLASSRVVPSPEKLRQLGAVEVLELTALPDAREPLGTLAKGAPEVRLKREAEASLERLAKRAPAIR
jgi:hypothetical protein